MLGICRVCRDFSATSQPTHDLLQNLNATSSLSIKLYSIFSPLSMLPLIALTAFGLGGS